MVHSMAQSLQQLSYVLVFQDHNLSLSTEKRFRYHGTPPICYSNSYSLFVSVLPQTFSSAITTHLEEELFLLHLRHPIISL